MESLVAPSINLLILISLLVYKLRLPLRQFVADRHQTIRSDIQTVQEQLRISQEKYDEFSSKLKAIDAELVSFREQAKQDRIALKQRIISDSQRMATTLISDAKKSANALYDELKNELYLDLSTRVLARAEKLIQERLTDTDHQRIQREFAHQIEVSSTLDKSRGHEGREMRKTSILSGVGAQGAEE